MRVACLHTADNNIALFAAARRELGLDELELQHVVRADLLATAEQAGGLTTAIAAATRAALRELSLNVDAVLLTCSTLGPVVAAAAPSAAAPLLRADEALAREAAAGGGTVIALCTAPTTLDATREVFERAARTAGATVALRLVPGAWEQFRAGRQECYLAMVAAAADAAFAAGATTVALAQASMAGAVRHCRAGRPLGSPTAGLRAAVAAAGMAARA